MPPSPAGSALPMEVVWWRQSTAGADCPSRQRIGNQQIGRDAIRFPLHHLADEGDLPALDLRQPLGFQDLNLQRVVGKSGEEAPSPSACSAGCGFDEWPSGCGPRSNAPCPGGPGSEAGRACPGRRGLPGPRRRPARGPSRQRPNPLLNPLPLNPRAGEGRAAAVFSRVPVRSCRGSVGSESRGLRRETSGQPRTGTCLAFFREWHWVVQHVINSPPTRLQG